MKNTTLSDNVPKQNFVEPLYSLKRSTFVQIIAAILMMFFIHNMVANYINIVTLKNALAFYTVHNVAAAWILISTEAAIILLLFFRQTRAAGLMAVLLVSLFAAYIVYSTPKFPHDFGGLLTNTSNNTRTAILCVTAVISIWGICLSIRKNRDKNQSTTIENRL